MHHFARRHANVRLRSSHFSVPQARFFLGQKKKTPAVFEIVKTHPMILSVETYLTSCFEY